MNIRMRVCKIYGRCPDGAVFTLYYIIATKPLAPLEPRWLYVLVEVKMIGLGEDEGLLRRSFICSSGCPNRNIPNKIPFLRQSGDWLSS